MASPRRPGADGVSAFLQNRRKTFSIWVWPAPTRSCSSESQASARRHEARGLALGKSPVIRQAGHRAAMRRSRANMRPCTLCATSGGLPAHRGIEGKMSRPAKTRTPRQFAAASRNHRYPTWYWNFGTMTAPLPFADPRLSRVELIWPSINRAFRRQRQHFHYRCGGTKFCPIPENWRSVSDFVLPMVQGSAALARSQSARGQRPSCII